MTLPFERMPCWSELQANEFLLDEGEHKLWVTIDRQVALERRARNSLHPEPTAEFYLRGLHLFYTGPEFLTRWTNKVETMMNQVSPMLDRLVTNIREPT